MSGSELKEFVKTLSRRPGVYRMLDGNGQVIYVGKAANLRNRVGSYFGKAHDSVKTRAMLRQVESIDITVTRTEREALLLEHNLIKEFRPRYNILFRDDKSYPYLRLSTSDTFPRLSFYRGKRTAGDLFFGPYPSAGAARRTLNLTQKLFRLRQCDDSFFNNRSRPCLQYQIKRCTAPCVGAVDADEYDRHVTNVRLFLEGRNQEVIKALTTPMQAASDALDFERAAYFRDQIQSLRRIQEQQHVDLPSGDCDIIGCAVGEDLVCIQVFYVRGGRNLGNKAHFPVRAPVNDVSSILEAFIMQHYLSSSARRDAPALILTSARPGDPLLLADVLKEAFRHPVRIQYRVRSVKARWVAMARDNAEAALRQRLLSKQKYQARFDALRVWLNMEEPLERLECFDISHTRGEATVAACVVFDVNGAKKSAYRRFNIGGITPGDDYEALRQAVTRRYTRVKREDGQIPDLLLIDGGKGQMSAVCEVLRELQLDEIPVLGIAKGPSRKPGLETLIVTGHGRQTRLRPDAPELHLLQELRDEAHRFAITGHRGRRKRARNESVLERIEGIGQKRRRELLRHFGGMQGVERAGVEELARARGINRNLAQKIYDTLHGAI